MTDETTRQLTRSIRLVPIQRSGLFAFEVTGKILKSDIRFMADTLMSAFERPGRVNVLVDLAAYDGIAVDALFDSHMARAMVRSNAHINRYAVVGPPDWAGTMIRLFAPLTPIDERVFGSGDRAAAWAWAGVLEQRA